MQEDDLKTKELVYMFKQDYSIYRKHEKTYKTNKRIFTRYFMDIVWTMYAYIIISLVLLRKNI